GPRDVAERVAGVVRDIDVPDADLARVLAEPSRRDPVRRVPAERDVDRLAGRVARVDPYRGDVSLWQALRLRDVPPVRGAVLRCRGAVHVRRDTGAERAVRDDAARA